MIRVEGVSRTYGRGESAVHAVRDVSFTAAAGELVAIRGRSGAGKTTLLNVVGGLDRPTAGRVFLGEHEVSAASESTLLTLRRNLIGFVFQSFGLVPILSAAENVGVPMRLARVKPSEREERVQVLLELVGLGGHAAQRPYELSGGQQQRVAVARALVTAPALVLADEPTGNLDTQSTNDVLAVFDRLSASGRTIVLITHEPDVAQHAKRLIRLVDGRIVQDERLT